jgi:hypothetical protein
MFGEIKYEILDEVIIGNPENPGVWLRLERSEKGKKIIRSWSGAGKEKYWKVMYRYDVDKAWSSWKRICQRIR